MATEPIWHIENIYSYYDGPVVFTASCDNLLYLFRIKQGLLDDSERLFVADQPDGAEDEPVSITEDQILWSDVLKALGDE